MKVTILFDRRKTASKTKNGSVELLISHNGEQKIKSTGVRVKKHEWKNGMVVGRFDAPQLNAKIQKKYHEILALSASEDFCVKQISINQINVCDWIEERIKSRTDIIAHTKKIHYVALRALRESGLFHTFQDFTPKNLKLWDDWLRQKGTLTKQTAIHNYHKTTKSYLNIAVQLELIQTNPYTRFSSPKGESSGIRYLTEDERNRIEELELDGTMAIVRDMLIFSCYTGLADADLRKVKREDIIVEDGRQFIIDKRKKTGTRYKLMLLPKAQEILERYDYDLDRFTNQKCNQYLKAIQVMANIRTHLTMHVGRHTFATWALKKGVPIEVVSKMLAHADIQTTQIYAKVLQEEVTKGFELLK